MTNSTPIYLDYAATTPVDKRVVAKMCGFLSEDGHFGNPASGHAFGRSALEAIDWARAEIAKLLHTVPRNILFTSGATEANNLAIKGAAHFYQSQGKHIITSQTEHVSVLDTCAHLEQAGFEVTYLKPDKNGIIDLTALENAIRPDTILVSLMHVNNETGVIQDIAAIGGITRKRNIFLHVDAVQSVGKLAIPLNKWPVDLMSFSAHKLYGPKGIGALYLGDNPRVKLAPLLHGGGQERKMRAGTLPTHQIVGMGEAFRIAGEDWEKDHLHLQRLKDRFLQGIQDLPGVYVNGHPEHRVANILNLCFEAWPKEKLLEALKPLGVSSASACNSISLEPSHVLRAMGLSFEAADRAFRFSWGRFTTVEALDYAISLIRSRVMI